MLIHPGMPQPQQLDGFLYKILLKRISFLASGTPVIYGTLAFVLLMVQALMINQLVNAQRLMQKPNYLAGMSYLLVTSLFSDWYDLSSPLIINFLLIWVLMKLCNLNNSNHPKSTLFNTGMAIGLATFFYFPSIAFALLIIVGLGITRPFRINEWLIVLLGILAPYYFLAAWVFFTGSWKGYRFPGFSITIPAIDQSALAYSAFILVFLSILIGFFFIRQNFRKQVVQVRKSWSLIFLYLLVALIVPFLNASERFDYWILTAAPIAAIAGANFFYPERKIVPLFLHWSMAFIGLVIGYYLK